MIFCTASQCENLQVLAAELVTGKPSSLGYWNWEKEIDNSYLKRQELNIFINIILSSFFFSIELGKIITQKCFNRISGAFIFQACGTESCLQLPLLLFPLPLLLLKTWLIGDDGECRTRVHKTLALCPVCVLTQYASLLAWQISKWQTGSEF